MGKKGQQKRQALKQQTESLPAEGLCQQYLHVIMCVCTCVYVCVKAHMYCAIHVEVRDNLKESVVSFHHVGPRDSTQVTKLRGRQL